MRLLNTSTLKLEQFDESIVPDYAILSHTWDADEITFKELQSSSQDELRTRKGYEKISFTTLQALQDGLEYVWIDTCCIDKSSSAELSDAINSMFYWYRDAEICYAYLSDVICKDFENRSSVDSVLFNISQSRWFTRGWTLQELIAPRRVKFFGYPWSPLGTREELMQTITRVTGIPGKVLQDADAVFDFSVAQRMSWAAERTTTRTEDRAYSLLGIFGVNMPLLYGEGNRAFFRLQEEIMKMTDDLSLFAWAGTEAQEVQVGSLLVESPSAFLGAGETVSELGGTKGFCMMRRKSLMVSLPILPFGKHSNGEDGLRAIAILPCRHYNEPNVFLGLSLTKSDPKLPWKRIWGGNQGLVRVALDQADRATIQTIEVDISTAFITATEEDRYLEYHGRVAWSNLIWDGWSRPLGDDQQELWNTAIKKAMDDLQIEGDDSKNALVAVRISILDGGHETRDSSPHRQLTMSYGPLDGACTQEQDLDRGEMAVHPDSMAARETGANVQIEEDFKSSDAHSQHLRVRNRLNREGSYPRKIPLRAFEGGRIFTEQSGNGSSQFWLGNTDVGQTSSVAEGLSPESEIETNEAEERPVDAEGEMHDCESMVSDIESEDTSSTVSITSSNDEDASLLDVLVDVLVDIITERRGIPAALLGDTKSLDIESYRSYQTDWPAEQKDGTALLRTRKRKADADDCGGSRADD